jgi:hypothetical protein
MDFTASSGGGGSYEKPKPGNYTGILIGFCDIGTHEGQFGAKRRVMLRWELHKRKGPSLDSGGNTHTTTAMYNQSFDAKSSLRPVVEAHIGPVKDGDGSSSRDWLGKTAKLVLKESEDGKYINVDAVTPLDPEEDEAPEQREVSVHWEIGDSDRPPLWAKHMVERSREWKQGQGGGGNGAPALAGAASGKDEDIPF